MVDLTALDPASIRLLQQLLDREKRRSETTRGRGPVVQDETQSPEVYVAHAPTTGIDAMVGATPGRAECTVLQVLREDTPSLVVAQPTQEVHNISYDDVPPNAFGVIVRDAYGSWIWLETLAPTSSTAGFTGCRMVLNQCTNVIEAWTYEDGVLLTVAAGVCPDCPTDTGTGTSQPTDCYCGPMPNNACLTLTPFGSSCFPATNVLLSKVNNISMQGEFVNPCNGLTYIAHFDCITLPGTTLTYQTWFECPSDRTKDIPPNLGSVMCDPLRVSGSFFMAPFVALDFFGSYPSYMTYAIVEGICSTDTGTGTGTGTTGPCEVDLGSICSNPLPCVLTLTVVSGCSTAATPRTMTYSDTDPDGPAWYTPLETVGGHSLRWSLRGSGGGTMLLTHHCDGVSDGSTFTPVSCDPFDSGAQGVLLDFTSGNCCGGSLGAIVRITE